MKSLRSCTTKTIPTNAYKCIENSLYKQRTPTCFDQRCVHLQGRKDTKVRDSKVENEIIKVSETVQTRNISEDGEIVCRNMCEFIAHIT
jgi:hypothetical protein